ncbi:MAG: hypothetical protein ACRCZF_22040 [Gemmataceae bacterium]
MARPSPTAVASFPSRRELVGFIRAELCKPDALEPTSTPCFQMPLHRDGRITAWLFHIEGPRQLRTSAVWSIPEDRVLFYNSTGQKFHEVQLMETVE